MRNAMWGPVAAQPLRLEPPAQLPPPRPPSAAHRPQRLRMAYVIYVNGSNRDRAYLGAAACIWSVDDRGNAARLQWPWHHVVALPGYFVGPATSELVAVILGYRMYNEFFHRHERTLSQLFTDSERAFGYADNDPTSPEGQKLLPLIRLMRAEIRSHPELTLCLCRGTENLAHPLAYNALQQGRTRQRRTTVVVRELWVCAAPRVGHGRLRRLAASDPTSRV